MSGAPEAACWLRFSCWSNNSAYSYPGPGAFNRRKLRTCLVLKCSLPPCRPHHHRRLANCDWMPASYTREQPFNSRKHPTCWSSSQWSHTLSGTQSHSAWTGYLLHSELTWPSSADVRHLKSKHPPTCTRRAIAQQFIWPQQHTCGALGGSPMKCAVDEQPHKTPQFNHRLRHPPSRSDPPKRSLGPA